MKIISAALILLSLTIFLFLFGPIIKQEIQFNIDQSVGIKYSVSSFDTWGSERRMTPVNTDFSILIPKINANAPVVDNVDPINPDNYLSALKEGVAHAAGTAYPGEIGNVYLFAHSTDAFYNIGKYNAVFFLLGHLNPGDEIDIFYRDRHYVYTVYDKKVVNPGDTGYLGTLEVGSKTLTLQTCYPPGTTLKRLVVLAKLESQQ